MTRRKTCVVLTAVIVGPLVAGCTSRVPMPSAAAARSDSECQATHLAGSMRVPSTDATGAVTDVFSIRNLGPAACVIKGIPSVEFDTGDPPGAVNNVATANSNVNAPRVLTVGGMTDYALGWESTRSCQPNHYASINRTLVALPHRGGTVVLSMSPFREQDRAYCWVDQITLSNARS
jgi:Protein of unknown function (DUF4232)